MTPDEVRLLDNRCAILLINGERPVLDQKYDILRHPNLALTEDGGAPPYLHGGTDLKTGTITAIAQLKQVENQTEESQKPNTWELLTNEEAWEQEEKAENIDLKEEGDKKDEH